MRALQELSCCSERWCFEAVGSIYFRVSRSVCNTPTFNLHEILDLTEVRLKRHRIDSCSCPNVVSVI